MTRLITLPTLFHAAISIIFLFLMTDFMGF